jgi:transcriptional antiterminator NusG
MAKNDQHWYALCVRGGRETRIAEEINNAVTAGSLLSTYVSQVLVPTEKRYENRTGGKRVLRERCLMPGNVFVRCNLTRECINMLLNIDNDAFRFQCLPGTKTPATIPDRQIEAFMGSVDKNIENIEVENPFQPDDKVRVTTGSFSGFDGIVEEVHGKRLKVRVTVFGRETLMELDWTEVEKQ